MNQRAQTIEHLKRSDEDSSLRRALAARLDTARWHQFRWCRQVARRE